MVSKSTVVSLFVASGVVGCGASGSSGSGGFGGGSDAGEGDAGTGTGTEAGSPGTIGTPGAGSCGDGACNSGESCTSCALDCGQCPACLLAPSCSNALGIPTSPTPRADLSQGGSDAVVDAGADAEAGAPPTPV